MNKDRFSITVSKETNDRLEELQNDYEENKVHKPSKHQVIKRLIKFHDEGK